MNKNQDDAAQFQTALEGKVAIVTGASRGIGRAIARRLAASGAIVAVNYASNEKAAHELISEIEAEGGNGFAIRAPLGELDTIEAFVAAFDEKLIQRTGNTALDILVNNVGGGGYGSIETTTPEVYDQTFKNNVRVPFFLTQALLPRLRSGGQIINISSAAPRLAGPDFIAYSMSKAAVNTFTLALAKHLGPRSITVNSVGPGFTATDSNIEVSQDPQQARQIADATALGRFGETADIADFVHALVLPAGRWVTGQNIEASGGFQL